MQTIIWDFFCIELSENEKIAVLITFYDRRKKNVMFGSVI